MDLLTIVIIGLFLAGGLQLLLWVCFLTLAERIGRAASIVPEGVLPPVSILLCTRNAVDSLRQNLPLILEQHYPCFEVIVVDDGSADGTPVLLAALQREWPALRIVRIEEKGHPGKKEALTVGIQAAQYEHLLFTDADCRPASRHWAAGMMAAFKDDPEVEIVLGYSPPAPVAPYSLLQHWVRFETLYTAWLYTGMARAGRPYMGVGRNLAWKKVLFEKAGGFSKHAHLTSGDDDLLVQAVANRHNVAVCLREEAWTWTQAPGTWPAWIRQKRRHLSAGRAYRPAHQMVLSAVAFTQAGFYSLLLAAMLCGIPWKISLIVLFLRLGLVALTIRKAGGKLGCGDLWYRAPVLDPMLALYYGLLVPILLLSGERGKW